MKFFIICIISIRVTSFLTFGQVQEWVSRYDGPINGSDRAYSIAVDDSGNVYVTGVSYNGGITYVYATIKYNSAGVQQWAAIYDSQENNDAATSIAVDGSGNVYVTGTSGTVKYNSSGVQQWVSAIGSMQAIVLDINNNVYVTGSRSSDYITIKYNSSGVQQWFQTYNGPGNIDDGAYSLGVDISGNVFVTGYTGLSSIHSDYATVKYNSSGVQQWVQIYGPGNNRDDAYSLAIDFQGNVYVTGRSYSTSDDFATIKYNSSGVQQWVQRYNGPANSFDWATSIAADNSGNIYVTGMSYGIGTLGDYATIKYNSSGMLQWVQRYNGIGNGEDRASRLALDSLDNIYVTGQISSSGTNKDYATIKYNSLGAQQWVQSYNGTGNSTDYAYAIDVDAAGNVYVTGMSRGSVTSDDYATIKYSQLVGIRPVSLEIPKEFNLIQNYPNPFNPTTHLRFDLAAGKGGISELRLVKLAIYDALGREVTTLVNEQLQPGTYEVEFDASNYPSGVYYYKLNINQAGSSTGDYSETKKMVLIK